MRASEVLKYITDSSSISLRAASKRMGRYPTFLATSRQLSVMPKLDTITIVADIYGYDIVLRNRESGDEIIIDPPEQTE